VREQKAARAGEEHTGGGQRAGAEGSARRRRAHGRRATRGSKRQRTWKKSTREEDSTREQKVARVGGVHGRKAARGNFSFLRAPRALALDSCHLLPPFFLPNAYGASESSTGRRFNTPGDAILSTVMASTTLEDSARPDA
jgi:hypothetical protein